MRSRTQLFVALAVAGLAVLGLVALLAGSRGSPRQTIASRYELVDREGGGSAVYASSSKPRAVADEIAEEWRPAERINDPGGYFLRYGGAMVAVTAAPGGAGSRIYVDDDRRGYARWYPYVGGYWGTFSGRGEGFRGGGPGAGK